MSISFDYLKKIFPEDTWDLGVLSPELFYRANLHPIKTKIHTIGIDYSNENHFHMSRNVLILVCKGHTWDYTHYHKAMQILHGNGINDSALVYTNFKESAILAGLGVRAKNSLIYSYKFGFDCHIAAVRFDREIVDLPINKRINYKIWNRCIGCDDCAKACPVGAIHNSSKNEFEWWLDSLACDKFIGLGEHPTIPSIKYFWQKNVHPEIDIEKLKNITGPETANRPFNEGGLEGMPFDKNGYEYDGMVVRKHGKAVNVPFCRECTSQPRCSKWNGKYPYDKVLNQEYIDGEEN